MKKTILILMLALLIVPFISNATRIEIPGLVVTTEVPETGPSGTVTVKVTCALVSTDHCMTIEAGPVLPPVVLSGDLPTYNATLHNTNITIFQSNGVTPIYSGNLDYIDVTPLTIGGSSANRVDFHFNPAP